MPSVYMLCISGLLQSTGAGAGGTSARGLALALSAFGMALVSGGIADDDDELCIFVAEGADDAELGLDGVFHCGDRVM